MRSTIANADAYHVVASPFTASVAGAGSDNNAVAGVAFDRLNAETVELVLCGTATLGQDETISVVNVALEESEDNSTFDTAVNIITTDQVLATGDTGGSTESFAAHFKIDLATADVKKRYLRITVTYDLSRADTDTANTGVLACLSGNRIKKSADKVELTA